MSDADLPKLPDGEPEAPPPAPPDEPASPAPDAMPPPSDGPTDGHFEPPRLSILDLLVWTAVAAVLLKLNLALMAIGHLHGNATDALAIKAVSSIQAILKAAGFVGCSVLVISWRGGRAGEFQPGHWMLLAEVPVDAWTTLCSMGLGLVVWASGFSMRAAPENGFDLLICAALGPACLWRGAMYFAASRRTRDGGRWRLLFLGLAIMAVCPALWPVIAALGGPRRPVPEYVAIAFIAVQFAYDLLVCVTFLTTAAIDLRNRRDWLHWLGIVLGGCGTLASAVPCLPYLGIALLLG